MSRFLQSRQLSDYVRQEVVPTQDILLCSVLSSVCPVDGQMKVTALCHSKHMAHFVNWFSCQGTGRVYLFFLEQLGLQKG